MSARSRRRYVTSEVYARELRCPKCSNTVHCGYSSDRLDALRKELADARQRKRQAGGRHLRVHDDAILQAEAELNVEAFRVGVLDRLT